MGSKQKAKKHGRNTRGRKTTNDEANHGNERSTEIVDLASEIVTQIHQNFIPSRLQTRRNSVIVAPSLFALESARRPAVRHVENPTNGKSIV